MKKKQTSQQNTLTVKDIFNQATTANSIVIFKNSKQNKVFVFNTSNKADWDFMFNLIKDYTVLSQNKTNDIALNVEITLTKTYTTSLLNSFKSMFKK